MRKQPSRGETIGGSAVRLDDCHVWAAISYLDSPTDYREYLPYVMPERPAPSGSELRMLEASSRTWSPLQTIMLTAFLICVFLLLIIRACDWESLFPFIHLP
jgi:hypothetical protein